MVLECPRCSGVELEEIELDQVLIDRCPQCGGLWFDNAEIGEIVGREPGRREFESIVPPSRCSTNELTCPRCDAIALRRLSSQAEDGREHILYRCVSCIGTWLDRGELREEEDSGLVDVLKEHFKHLP